MEEQKILTKEEMREERKKKFHYWRKVMFPDEFAVIRFISMSTLDPGIAYLFICYVTGTLINLPLTYLIVDTMVIIWWISDGFKRKKEWEEMAIDRTESIRQKIEELKQAEAERLRREHKLKEREEPWI